MIRHALIAVVLSAAPAFAEDSKEDSCRYQGQVMSAVQQARLDGVKQEDVVETIVAAEPAWPDAYSNALPQLSAHIYGLRKRDLRKTDFGAILEQQCLDNWDQIQEMKKQLQSN
ncbi:hypothetical protein [Phaeobacter sp.]|uniref:hypothetical protein n=1 Tax=Phaeobacter sp. TaxID=1902409 RepID=UPI0025F9CF26|nr:hypothetical protein [Phaeobacter sp.]